MKTLCMILFFVTICVGFFSCYEYQDHYFDQSDEDYDSDEVKYGFDDGHHYPSDEGHHHHHEYGKEIKQSDSNTGKVQQDKGVQWHYTKPAVDEVKPVYEEVEDSVFQQNMREVFGTSEGVSKVNQNSGIKRNLYEQPPTPENNVAKVTEQEDARLSPNLQQFSRGPQLFPSFGRQDGSQEQRFRRQAATESVIEIDGVNVKFNQDQGFLTGLIPTTVVKENGGALIMGSQTGSTWTTSEPPVTPPQEVKVSGQNENTDVLPTLNQQVKEDDNGLLVSQVGVTPFISTEQPPVGETDKQETGFAGISLINIDNVSQITPNLGKEAVPLKIGTDNSGLKYNKEMKADYENGYNEGFKDGYHKGAKEGFHHGAKHGCHSTVEEFGDEKYIIEHEQKIAEVYHEEEKPITQKEVKESYGGEVTIENQDAIAEVQFPVVTPNIQEEIKEVGGGKVTILHEDTVLHVNKPVKDEHYDEAVEKEGSGKVKVEHGKEIAEVTKITVTPSYEEMVKENGGGDITVVQEDAVAQIQTPAVTPVVQEMKKEVIKTNKKPEHKDWHHGHHDHDGHDGQYHDYYHHYHHGDDYHHGHKGSYPHNPQYHGNGQYHVYYHHGSKYDHHGPSYYHGYPHSFDEWDSSEEDYYSDSKESNVKHVGKRSMEKPAPYHLKEALELFRQFMKDYNKEYKDEAEFQKRYQNFVKNLEDINKMNAADNTATFGINMFADLSDDELGNL